jgi:hypothetical protein
MMTKIIRRQTPRQIKTETICPDYGSTEFMSPAEPESVLLPVTRQREFLPNPFVKSGLEFRVVAAALSYSFRRKQVEIVDR